MQSVLTRRAPWSVILALGILAVLQSPRSAAGQWTFTDVTDAAGIQYEHDYVSPPLPLDEVSLEACGVAAGDYDGDGRLDLLVLGVQGTPPTLFRNRGDGTFEDVTPASGIVGSASSNLSAAFGDYDRDGDLDVVMTHWMQTKPNLPGHHLFRNNGDGTFTDVGEAAGISGFTTQDDTFTGNFVDYDHDGDIDLFVSNNQQAPHLWRNDGGNAGHFLDLKLHGLGRNTEAIGGRIYVITGGQTQMRELRAGSNFLSQDPAEAHFGLGTAAAADEVHIMWPDGRVTRMTGVAANRRLRVTEQASTCTADACTGGDPCTTATCVDGACVSEDVTGLASASCVCERPESAACTNQRLPRGFTTARGKACKALRKASHGKTGKKLQNLCKQAGQSWQHAANALGKPKTKAKVAASCLWAVTNAVTDASVRADRVAKESAASSAPR